MSDYMVEFPEDDVIEVLFDDVIVTGAEPPSGTISITENGSYDVSTYAEASVNVPEPSGSISITQNGTVDVKNYASANVNVPQGVFPTGTLPITQNGSYDVTNYAGASVNVPEPSGSISITQNGTVDVKNYASANVNVPQGVFPTGTLPITQNGSYDVTNYAGVNVNVSGGGLPAYMSISEQTIQNNTDNITFAYDNTRTVLQVICYNENNPDTTGYNTNILSFFKSYSGDNYIAFYLGAGSGGGSAASLQYGSISFDSENSNITITTRGGNYQFKSGKTYRIIIIYTET